MTHTPTPWASWNVPVVNTKFHRKLGPMIILSGHDDDIVFAVTAVNAYEANQARIAELELALKVARALMLQEADVASRAGQMDRLEAGATRITDALESQP